MPIVPKALLLTAACICFVIAGFGKSTFRMVTLVPTGLALVALVWAFDAWAAVD